MPKVRVSLESVSHSFEKNRFLFNNISCRFDAGDIWAITGPSGSGKSTLLSLIAGIFNPTHGSIVVTSEKAPVWVFQNPYGMPKRTAIDHVSYPFLTQGYQRKEASMNAMKIMHEFGLDSVVNKPYSLLSGGEATRLMLARAVAANPDILLVDEPTSQLDARSSIIVSDYLRALAGKGRIVLIASHDQNLIDKCDSKIDLIDFI